MWTRVHCRPRIRRLSVWFDSDCRRARRKTRLLERRYRRSKATKTVRPGLPRCGRCMLCTKRKRTCTGRPALPAMRVIPRSYGGRCQVSWRDRDASAPACRWLPRSCHSSSQTRSAPFAQRLKVQTRRHSVYTLVNSSLPSRNTHLKLQKSQKGDITQQHFDI